MNLEDLKKYLKKINDEGGFGLTVCDLCQEGCNEDDTVEFRGNTVCHGCVYELRELLSA